MGKDAGSGRGSAVRRSAIFIVSVALVAAALPDSGARAATTTQSSVSSTFKRISPPKGNEIKGLGGSMSHVTAPGDWRQRMDDLKRFNHTVVYGSNGEVLRVIVLGPKKAPPRVPRAKPIRIALALDTKIPDRGMALLKPGMRSLGWPLTGVKISSGFGMREHPILGGPRRHSGVDMPAGFGTPVHAPADGTIRYRGRKGAYGRFIRLDHGFGLETAYGHLRGYAKDLHRGTRVRRGEVIGYVGSSGLSTGPHLHYEVRMNGRAVDPLPFLPAAPRLVRAR
ncbi:MAG: M23 family metallopeptidase [Limibaculum sp.]